MATKWMTIAMGCMVLSAGWSGGAWAQGAGQIVLVNMEEVFSEYYKTQRADERLKEKAEEFSEERQQMIDELRALEETFEAAREEAQDSTLSERAREKKREEAEEKLAELKVKEREIRAYEEERRTMLEQQGKRMRQRIVDEITEAIERLAEERGYFLVIDSSGESKNNIPLLIYYEDGADITADVVSRLNKDAVDFEQPSDDSSN